MRRHDLITERLAQVPMFAACSTRELHHVSRLATEIHVEAGRELTVEGRAGHEFLIVLDGRATVRAGGVAVATLTAGDYFGEIALLDDGPRTATVVAETPMTLAVVGQREFSALLDEVPGLARQVLRGLAHRLRADATTPV
jgi:CRP-like cAMP-binding protein